MDLVIPLLCQRDEERCCICMHHLLSHSSSGFSARRYGTRLSVEDLDVVGDSFTRASISRFQEVEILLFMLESGFCLGVFEEFMISNSNSYVIYLYSLVSPIS